MTNPNDPHDADFRATLPADLQDLDRELSAIRIEERPSFRPELEGELLRAWQARSARETRVPRRWVRGLVAASLAGLMIAGMSVPSARASVIEFVQGVAQGVESFFAPEAAPVVELPEIQVEEPVMAPVVEQRTEVVVSPADASEDVEMAEPDLPTIPEVEITFPELISRQEASAMIASHYPVDLQQAGVEGSVKLLFWVGDQGIPENVQRRTTSGNARLDFAAVRAARDLRFHPATRNGSPVGTWVEVDVHFFALTGAGIIGPDSTDGGF